MTKDFFLHQVTRLQTRFGDRAIDAEFVKLVWAEIHEMNEQDFLRAVNVWIGSRPYTKPPLLTEFREARMASSKNKFESDLRGSANFLSRKAPEEMRNKLKQILSKEHGGVDSLRDALEVAKLNLRLKRSEK